MLKRTSRKQEGGDEEDVNVTPLLDIVFIMLIFFIVTATFIKEPGVEVERPRAGSAEEQKLISVLVAITADNEIWINKKQVAPDGVRFAVERLRRENPKGRAVIQVDAGAHSKVLLDVLGDIQDAGVSNVAVSAKKS